MGWAVFIAGCPQGIDFPVKDGGNDGETFLEENCPGQTGQVGSCCLTHQGCRGEFVCIDFQIFGGLCTKDCALDHSCPEGSRCIRLVYDGEEQGLACFESCEPLEPSCTKTDYICRQVGETTIHICYPY